MHELSRAARNEVTKIMVCHKDITDMLYCTTCRGNNPHKLCCYHFYHLAAIAIYSISLSCFCLLTYIRALYGSKKTIFLLSGEIYETI